MFVREMKLAPSYTNIRFTIPGFFFHWNDLKENEGGIMAILSISIKKIYKTLEAIAVEVKRKVGNVIMLRIYRTPKTSVASIK